MSTGILSPIKGGTLEEILKVLWVDMDHGKELMPYIDPIPWLAGPTNSYPLYSSCKGSDKRISGISIGFKSSLQDDFCA
ncbi:unnamed protein product [Nyctereutes procyonoides]|uniref:(raccoon dog) hypothetical protein n=1 Tax=Nyctereutes procyonoides TaxID=34880 RepID=A0A812A0I1_NYCPR|nr:unnamed protein product [Nyctereutes procyonoides]